MAESAYRFIDSFPSAAVKTVNRLVVFDDGPIYRRRVFLEIVSIPSSATSQRHRFTVEWVLALVCGAALSRSFSMALILRVSFVFQ